MAMNPRLLRPLASGVHPEAAAWRSSVVANGGSVSASTMRAVSTFCASIDAAGIRDRFYRLNLFCGDGLTAALVPLYRAESRTATARGNATDTNNGPFVSGDYNNTGSSAGLIANGSKYLATGLSANAFTASNLHMGFGLLANNESGTGQFPGAIGAFTSPLAHIVSVRRGGGADALSASNFGGFANNNASAGPTLANTNLSTGNIVAAWPDFFINAVATGKTATTSLNFTTTVEHFVFAVNNNNTGPTSHAEIRLGWYSLGLTMTSAQVTSFNNALNAFATTLART
jgi:hypothetical protein